MTEYFQAYVQSITDELEQEGTHGSTAVAFLVTQWMKEGSGRSDVSMRAGLITRFNTLIDAATEARNKLITK